MRLATPAILGLATLLAGAAMADTATAPPPARIACRASVIQLCPLDVASGDRSRMRVCLLKNLDKASPDCQAAVKAAQAEAATKKADAQTPVKQ